MVFSRQSAGREAEPLPRLDRGARQDESAHFSVAEGSDAHRDRQIALPGAGWSFREHEVVLADGLDVPALVLRLRSDPFSAHGRRDDVAHLRRGDDGPYIGIGDQSLERGFAKLLIAPRERAHRADEIAKPRDRLRVAADAQLRAARHDLHAELALQAIDVRFVVPGDEHHLVRVRDQDRDLRRRRGHTTPSLRSAPTTPETTLPSARPFVSAITLGMTSFVSCGPFAPVSAITRRAISRIFDSSNCSGRYALMNPSSFSSFSTRSSSPPLRNASIESRRIFACFVSTPSTAASSSSPGLFCASHVWRAASSLPSAVRRSIAAPRRAFSS